MKQPKDVIFEALDVLYNAMEKSLGEAKHQRGITTPLLAFILEKGKLPHTKESLQHPPLMQVINTFNSTLDSMYNDAIIWCKRQNKREIPLSYFKKEIDNIKKVINKIVS